MKYCHEFSHGLLVLIITDNNLPAPLAFVEMISSSSKKECLSNKCRCFKNNPVCIDLCKRTLCKNDVNDAEKNIFYTELDDN